VGLNLLIATCFSEEAFGNGVIMTVATGAHTGQKRDMNSMQKNMNSMHNGMEKEATQTGILKNKDMQRLHK